MKYAIFTAMCFIGWAAFLGVCIGVVIKVTKFIVKL